MKAIATVTMSLIAASAALAACKDDESCRTPKMIDVRNAVTGEKETWPAATCTGTMVCDGKERQLRPLEAAYTGNAGPCSRAFLRQFEGQSLPTNCRDLKVTATPICLEGSGATGAGPGEPGPVPPGGATSGGDFPRGEPDAVADEVNWVEVDQSSAKESADEFKRWYKAEFGIDVI
jgi:hypothetical protein